MQKGTIGDELFVRYDNLVWYAANCYRAISSAVDVDDLHQEGWVLLLKTWQRTDIPEEAREPMFKKSLFLALRSKAYKQASLANHLVGLKSDEEGEGGIDLNTLFATSDVQVLSKVYADEFVGELRRLVDPETREVLDFLLDVQFEEHGEIEKRGDWVPAVARRLDRTVNEIYYMCWKMKRAARALAPKFGYAAA